MKQLFQEGQKIICITKDFENINHYPQFCKLYTVKKYSIFFDDALELEEVPGKTWYQDNFVTEKEFRSLMILDKALQEAKLEEYLLSTPIINNKKEKK